jgi:RNA polymerase sigma-70 factor (ECF subfamily)
MDAENKAGTARERRSMEGLDLESVIERARGRDTQALGEIYRRYAKRVFGLCRHLLGSPENAEDATSEVFLKLQRSIGNYDGSTPFPGWLLRVAGNQCIDILRRRQRSQRVIAAEQGGDSAVEAPSPEVSPLGAMIGAEERKRLRDVIATLPENYRVPLVLRYYSELSYDEIGQQLGIESSYVGALIFRAKQELRRKLAKRS